MVTDGAPTPESFWSYQADDGGPPPEGWTWYQWERFSPHMRRDIKREMRRQKTAEAYHEGAEREAKVAEAVDALEDFHANRPMTPEFASSSSCSA